MNERLLLVNAIILLYQESLLPGPVERSVTLVRNVLSTIKLQDNASGFDTEASLLIGLKKIALSMCDDPSDHQYELTQFLNQIRTVAGDENNIYEIVKSALSTEIPENSLKRSCLNYKRQFQNYFREEKVKEILRKASAKIHYNREDIPDVKRYVAEICAELEPYQADAITSDPAVVAKVSFAVKETVENAFKAVQQQSNGNSLMRTGWQAFNRMIRGGFRRGEQVVVAALQHNFKTGMSLSLFKHLALYNTPQMIDPTKKPLLLRISFEDEVETNMQWLYASLKENETLQKVTEQELAEMDPAEIASYVIEKMTVNGYHIDMLRVDPSQWTYIDICNKALEYESEGYEIHAVFLDYLAMVPTTGCTQGPAGTDIRDLFRRIRNFFSQRKALVVTPHQLSTEAKQLIRDGRQDLVKEIANKGYYAGCRQLDQEVDLEIYIHIEIVNGKSYLTIQRGKHRGIVGQTPIEDKYTVLPFEDVGAIRDDVLGVDSSRRKPGGGPRGSAEEMPFWEDDRLAA